MIEWRGRRAARALRSGGSVSRGKARGLRRYRCKAIIRRARNRHGAATAPRRSAGCRSASRWPDTPRLPRAAGRCAEHGASLAPQCFLFGKTAGPVAGIPGRRDLRLESRKGERKLNRKPRRRRKRGLSREQVPILVAADRTGAPSGCTSQRRQRERSSLEPVIARLVSDASGCYPPAARRSAIPHESIKACARRPAHPDGQQPPQLRSRGFCEPSAVATKNLDS